jgi:hypothetical protein
MLERGLASSSRPDRLRFFQECIRLRRPQRLLVEDTPIAAIFASIASEDGVQLPMEREWLLLQMQRRVALVRRAIKLQVQKRGGDDDVGTMFDEYDEAGNGTLNPTEMLRLLQGLNVQKQQGQRGKRQVLWTATDAAELCRSLNSVRDDGGAGVAEAVMRCTFIETFGASGATLGSKADGDADIDADAALAKQLMADEASGRGAAASDAFSFADDLPRVPPGKWMCMTCTMHNPVALFYCEVCDMARPDLVHTRF